MEDSDEQGYEEKKYDNHSGVFKRILDPDSIDARVAASQLARNSKLDTCNGVFLSVLDDGPGISPFEQTKLFKLFGVLESNRSMNKKGCGLGLTICKKITTKMEGDIGVMSKVGQGTLFV